MVHSNHASPALHNHIQSVLAALILNIEYTRLAQIELYITIYSCTLYDAKTERKKGREPGTPPPRNCPVRCCILGNGPVAHGCSGLIASGTAWWTTAVINANDPLYSNNTARWRLGSLERWLMTFRPYVYETGHSSATARQ